MKRGEEGGRGGESICARKLYNPSGGGTKSDGCESNASVYYVYPVSRIAGEDRAEFLREGGGRGEFHEF